MKTQLSRELYNALNFNYLLKYCFVVYIIIRQIIKLKLLKKNYWKKHYDKWIYTAKSILSTKI